MQDRDRENFLETPDNQTDSVEQELTLDEDIVMEQILKNLNTTSIGQVLKKIASLPEVRQEKVLGIRRKLTAGKYDVNDRLDNALDKVLEDLIT